MIATEAHIACWAHGATEGNSKCVLRRRGRRSGTGGSDRKKPALILIETPSNPLMRVVDIRAIAKRAKAVGAKTAVDNTFLSPALQRPIELGADFVIHSTTKYLNGHSDVVGGAVVAADRADLEELSDWAKLRA